MTVPITADITDEWGAIAPPAPPPASCAPPPPPRTAGEHAVTAKCMEKREAVKARREAVGGRSSSGARYFKRRNVRADSFVSGDSPASGIASERCCRFCTGGKPFCGLSDALIRSMLSTAQSQCVLQTVHFTAVQGRCSCTAVVPHQVCWKRLSNRLLINYVIESTAEHKATAQARTLRRPRGLMSRGGEDALLHGSSREVSAVRAPTALTSSARNRLHLIRESF
jgi:hypothetical protein